MRKQRWWLAVTCAAMLGLAGCSDQSPPQSAGPGEGTPAAGQDAQTDPYAGGKSYPWSDRVGPSGDPAATPAGFPWTGFHASAGKVGAAAVGGSDTAYLSDLSWTNARSAWGPVEKDMSNGEQGGGDGHPLTIGGQVFAKGLGVHAASEITFTLNGLCTNFSASIGVDDEVGARGSVTFEVWNGTATRLYSSATLTGNDVALPISVDVSNVQNLRLVVTDAGNGINNDHADWADAKIVCPPKPLSGQTYLSDLLWKSASSGWGPIERDLSNGDNQGGDGHPLTLGGQVYTKGLGVHALSTITYALSGQCSAFDAQVGVDDEVADRGSVVFQVFGDGALLFDSGVLRGPDAPKALSVPVTGVQELKLVVGDSGNGVTNDHARLGRRQSDVFDRYHRACRPDGSGRHPWPRQRRTRLERQHRERSGRLPGVARGPGERSLHAADAQPADGVGVHRRVGGQRRCAQSVCVLSGGGRRPQRATRPRPPV